MSEETAIADVALMARVRQGDEAAFEMLHGRYQSKLLNFFYVLSRNSHTANDLCQETFLRVWKVRARYKATGSFPGYLFGIGRLVWLENCRALRKQTRLGIRHNIDETWEPAANPCELPDNRAARREMQDRILAALDELPEEQRLVFVMRNIKGLSLADIAAALDCPVNTVRSRKLLAIKKLRHTLSNVFVTRQERTL